MIEDAHVPLSMGNANSLAAEILGAKDENDKRIEVILLAYYIQNHWDKDAFEVVTCGGYYGEEIDAIHFGGNFEKNIDAFLALPVPERIQMAVTPRDIMVHPKLRNITGCVLDTVNVKDLVFTNRNSLKTDYFKHYVTSYKNWFVPVCNRVNGKYEVLEGNHRAKAIEEAKKTKIEAIIVA